jgi:hypothetical protein
MNGTKRNKSRAVHLDNIATRYAPVWRARVTTPLTPRAVRQQLMTQANELHEMERQRYVRRRLTALDRALDDDEADALERWLLCEEMLAGRVKIGNYGDQTGGGKNNASPIPDSMIVLVQAHMRDKRLLDRASLRVLAKLAEMTGAPVWDFGEAGRELFGTALAYSHAKRRFIRAVCTASARLCEKTA